MKQLTGSEARTWIETNLKNLQKLIMLKTFNVMTATHATDYYPQTAYRCKLVYDVSNRRPVLTVEE